MITYALSVSRSTVATWIFLMAGLLLISIDAIADEQPRLSVTTQSTRAERDAGMPGSTSEDEFPQMRTQGDRAIGKAEAQIAQSANVDFWFYTADVVLFADHDRDGYYHGIDLLFDADTWYAWADVYAVVYLSQDGGPWNEYAATDDFTLWGTSSEDEYVIVTELVSGYPTGSYDILIELFDADTHEFLAWYGPDDSSELAYLPLEDANRDVVIADTPNVTVVNNRGGGSTGSLFILLLGLAALARSRGVRYA